MSDYILSPQISKGLSDKMYDKRKGAALEVERIIREYVAEKESAKIKLTIQALVADFVNSVSPNARNGGLIGLAATSISLGTALPSYLESIVPPVLACFGDQESRVRYYACESMYNIAKVARGSVLRYFNELFDAMSKLYADSEMSVRNGVELLDRLVKDIVHEQSIAYSGPITHIDDQDPQQLALSLRPVSHFSLPRFIPLLAERVYSKNSWTRNYLVTWIAVLDSIPDLELVCYLPDFLDGLLYFLSDPNPDVRTLTQKLLSDFLAEIREVAELQQQQQHEALQARLRQLQMTEGPSPPPTSRSAHRNSYDGAALVTSTGAKALDHLEKESTGHGKGNWVPGQGVSISYAKIVKILKPHLTSKDEDIQETALRWINEFMSLAKDVMIQFTPALIPAVLPCLAHSVDSIRTIAIETNLSLYTLVYESALPPEPQSQPPPPPPPPPQQQQQQQQQQSSSTASGSGATGSERPASYSRSQSPRPQSPKAQERSAISFGASGSKMATGGTNKEQSVQQASSQRDSGAERVVSPSTQQQQQQQQKITADQLEFDYVATVNALTLQFLNEHEQTRVASLEWLLMLHKRAPHLILAIDDGSFPVLLKTLSDPSEEVIKRDLQLLAQISSHSDDTYFYNFMLNMLSLFSTDRRLLENRGSVIIRQLCVSLNSERIYRTLAEILEKDEDLEFANTMVQNLNIILITAPELADLRKRLKSSDSRDGQGLFTVLYKSWCHNPVSTFALCLMAQYYEHAVALLQSFAEFEITVNLLIQVDKLVQLIESPVFTYLRLQLLEPERYPHLFKCLYGLLMLLPQSTAFATLRNRLTSVSSMGFIHLVPKTPSPGVQGSAITSSTSASGLSSAGRSKPGAGTHGHAQQQQQQQQQQHHQQQQQHPEGPKFPDLLSHFKTVQGRHERSRRQAVQAMLRQSTYGASHVGMAGTAHYQQQQQYYQQHQQKHQRKQQQQLEHQQLQLQVAQQQQLFDMTHGDGSGGGASTSSPRTFIQDDFSSSSPSSAAAPALSGETTGTTTASAASASGGGNVVSSRRKTRDRGQLEAIQQQQQQQQPPSSGSSTTTTTTAITTTTNTSGQRTSVAKGNRTYGPTSSSSGTPPPTTSTTASAQSPVAGPTGTTSLSSSPVATNGGGGGGVGGGGGEMSEVKSTKSK